MATESLRQRIWSELTGTQLKLWHMAVAAIFTTAISTGIPLWVNHWDKHAELVHQRSKELVDVSSDFENSVTRLVNSGATFESPAELASLSLNVEQQIRALNKIRPELSDSEQKALADDYAVLLISVRDMLSNGLSPEETRQFGLAAQKLVLTRDKLLARLG